MKEEIQAYEGTLIVGDPGIYHREMHQWSRVVGALAGVQKSSGEGDWMLFCDGPAGPKNWKQL